MSLVSPLIAYIQHIALTVTFSNSGISGGWGQFFKIWLNSLSNVVFDAEFNKLSPTFQRGFVLPQLILKVRRFCQIWDFYHVVFIEALWANALI